MKRRSSLRPHAPRRPFCAPRISLALLCLGLLAAISGCAPTQPGGGPLRAPVLAPTDKATQLPTATPTPMPSATPTPPATPTPAAALAAGSPPVGQVVFSTARDGESWEELWQTDATSGLLLFQTAVAPGRWQCVGAGRVQCVFVTHQGALQASAPASGTLTLLDDLSVPALPGSESPFSSTQAISVTAVASDGLALGPAVVLTGTPGISQTQGIVAAGAVVTPSLAGLRLALAPDGAKLAVASPDGISVFDLVEPALQAQLEVTDTADLAWSPDSALVAVASPGADDTSSLVLWDWQAGTVRALAAMRNVGDLAWAPDGEKLAFVARQDPLTPASQGSQSDVFVVFLRSGEVANLTEVFLGNNGLPADQQVAAWSPEWEPDSARIRYVLGVPGEFETQGVMRHTLRSRRPTLLEGVPEAGLIGIASSPSGQMDARVVERDGRQAVQARIAGGEWLDVSPGTFDGVRSLIWAPFEPAPGTADDAPQERYLLAVSTQALYVLDVATGQIGGLAVACPTCTVTRAIWLP